MDKPSKNDATTNFLFALLVVGCLLLFFLLSAGVFVFVKHFFGLTLPYWTIVLAPIWLFLALLLPVGFTATNIILMLCNVVVIPWWGWIIPLIADILKGIFSTRTMLEWPYYHLR